MTQVVIALLAGVLFGAGLTVAQMVDPQKVLGFLDIAAMKSGGWDPTLLGVFAGALPVMFIAYAIQRKMAKPALAPAFMLPAKTAVDLPLVVGSATFGVGWGIAGICPGPALASLPIAGEALPDFALFTISMLAGVALSRPLQRLTIGTGKAGT